MKLKQKLTQFFFAILVTENDDGNVIKTEKKEGQIAGYGETRKIASALMFFFCVCFLPMIQCDVTLQSVNRLNFGVYYVAKSSQHAFSNAWRHSFVIDLPSVDFLQFNQANISIDEFSKMSFETILTNVRYQTKKEKGTYTSYEGYENNLKWLHKLTQDGIISLSQLSTAVEDLFPNHWPSNEQNKTKRAIFGFLKAPFRSLFGTANEDDIAALQSHIIQIAQNQNKQLQVMKTSTRDLNSFVRTSSERMDLLVENVKAVSIESIRMLNFTQANLLQHIDFISIVTLQAMKLQHALDRLEKQYQNLVNSVENLINGNIPSLLISKKIITEVLSQIQKELLKDQSNFHIIHADPTWYYRHAKFTFAKYKSQIIISLNIPLSALNSKFTIFKMLCFPMNLPDSSNTSHIMLLTNQEQGLAVSNDLKFYYTLTELQLDKALVANTQQERRIYLPTNDQSCALAIFLNNKTTVDQYCHYVIVMNSLKSSVNHLEKSQFLLFFIKSYTLNCLNKRTNHIGCQSCVIELPGNCSFESEKYFIPPVLSENTQHVILHTTNIPLLMKFFNSDSLNSIFGESLSQTVPQLVLPTFKYFDANVTENFAKDNQYKLSLHKAVQSVRNDEVIIESLDQAIVLGNYNLPDTFWTSAISSLFWIIVFVLLTVCGFSAYLFYRVKTLTALILVMKTQISPAEASAVNPPFIFNYFDTTPNSANTKGPNFHEIIIQTSNEMYPYIFFAVFVTLTLSYFLRKYYREKCSYFSFTTHTHVILEFISKQKSVYVKILKLKGQPAEYNLISKDFVTNISVSNYLFPTLHFNWNTLLIQNKLTKEQHCLPQSVKISILAGFILRKILDQEHACFAAWLFKGQRFQLIINDSEHIPTSPLTNDKPDPPYSQTIVQTAVELHD